jgi:hypothetical protein
MAAVYAARRKRREEPPRLTVDVDVDLDVDGQVYGHVGAGRARRSRVG